MAVTIISVGVYKNNAYNQGCVRRALGSMAFFVVLRLHITIDK